MLFQLTGLFSAPILYPSCVTLEVRVSPRNFGCRFVKSDFLPICHSRLFLWEVGYQAPPELSVITTKIIGEFNRCVFENHILQLHILKRVVND